MKRGDQNESADERSRSGYPGYPAIFVVTHWLLAVAIIAATAIGWYMVNIPVRTPERAYFFNLHKSIGLIALILILVTIGLRRWCKAPSLPRGLPMWQRRLAVWGHLAMYILLATSALSGYVGTNVSRWGIDFFGLMHLSSWGGDRPGVYQALKSVHFWSANILAALVVLHVMAVIKHSLSGHAILSRMTLCRNR